MLDLKKIRSDPDAFAHACMRRGLAPDLVKRLVGIDRSHRAALSALEAARTQRKILSDRVARDKNNQAIRLVDDHDQSIICLSEQGAQNQNSADKNMAQEIRQSQNLKTRIRQLEEQERELAKHLRDSLAEWPNLPCEDVPDGMDEHHNREIRRVGVPRQFAFTPKHHVELGDALQGMDFVQAARLSGSRFVILSGLLARLERALATFMLDIHVSEFNYRECSVPHLVNSRTIFNTGQLPKFADDVFQTHDDLWLIPTAEVPLTNLVAEQILMFNDLPLRFTAHTPCYRREAGAAGRDTRGLLRQHQFSKVELVSLTCPEDSDSELERMTQCAEAILQRLEIPYRIVLLCAGDMGFAACKTYDIEAWMPKEETYREISSCSNCADFQARRMKARFRDEKGKIRYLHSLNGSGLAIGRTMIALLENHQRQDGSIYLPPPLRPYMGGHEALTLPHG